MAATEALFRLEVRCEEEEGGEEGRVGESRPVLRESRECGEE